MVIVSTSGTEKGSKVTESSSTTAAAPTSPPSGLMSDVWGGLAAMLVALPSSIAFGVLIYTAVGPEYAGEGALAGILGAAALGIAAPLVGRNGGFITAPCAPAAAVMSGVALSLAAGGMKDTDRMMALMAFTALLSALFQVLYGSLRAGRLIKYIPFQVVSGYMSGVAVIIALGQLPKLLGLPKDVGLLHGLVSPASWKWQGIVVGIVTMTAMALAPRVTKKVPGAIIGVVSGVISYFVLALIQPGLLQIEGNKLIIGPIQADGSLLRAVGERATALFAFRSADVAVILVPALTLSVLLSIDTLKTGVVLDALTRRRHDSNRELIGQGIGNVASFLVGGMPGAGTMGPTLVNVTSGGRTLRSGLFEGLFVLAAFLALGQLIAWIPIGALAGILLVIAWRMFDFGMFRLLLRKDTRLDFVVIAAVVIVAEGVGLIQASVVGVCLAILLFIRDQIRGSVILRKRDLTLVQSKRRRLPAEQELLNRHADQAILVELQGNLFFGTTDQLFSELERDLVTRRFILLDMRRVQSMDFTAGHLFEQMESRLEERRGMLLFSGMPSSAPTRQDIGRYMAELGLVREGASIRVFETRDSAIEWIEDQILEVAGWVLPEEEVSLPLSEIEIFRDMDAASLEALARAADEVSVPAGGTIFSHHGEGHEVYLVRRGRVHIRLPLEGGKHHHLATVCQGDFFGEMAFIDRWKRSADAVAAIPVDLFVITRERFDEVARKNTELAAQVFERLSRVVSRRLRTADTELRALEER